MNLNKVFILGNVTRDPEVRATSSGQQITTFGLATNRFYTDGTGQKKQDVEFHNVVAFGRLADISSRYLNKGSMVLIEGRIKTRSWQNSQGIKQYRTEIIAENIQLAPKSMGGAGASTGKMFKSEAETPKENDIPIIEENYIPPNINPEENHLQDNPPEAKTVSFEKDVPTDEIDVKDIPF